MIRVHVGATIQPENLVEVLAIYQTLIAATLQEPGCISYELLQLRGNPCELMLAEQWLSQDHLDAHTRTTHFLHAMDQLESLEKASPALIYTLADVH